MRHPEGEQEHDGPEGDREACEAVILQANTASQASSQQSSRAEQEEPGKRKVLQHTGEAVVQTAHRRVEGRQQRDQALNLVWGWCVEACEETPTMKPKSEIRTKTPITAYCQRGSRYCLLTV